MNRYWECLPASEDFLKAKQDRAVCSGKNEQAADDGSWLMTALVEAKPCGRGKRSFPF